MTDCKDVDFVVGAQYGDEGKGMIAKLLADRAEVLGEAYTWTGRVGAQNAEHRFIHKACTFTARVLPSASCYRPGIKAILGAGHCFFPPHLITEARHLGVDLGSVYVDEMAMWLKEEHGQNNLSTGNVRGTTGWGVGAAIAEKVRRHPDTQLMRDNEQLREILGRRLCRCSDVIADIGGAGLVEGSQGAMLSLNHGHYPHCLAKDTKLLLADGSTASISDIVRKRLPGPVLSVNTKTGCVEPRTITAWHKSEYPEGKWLRVVTEQSSFATQDSCFWGPRLTPDHRVPLANGSERRVGELIPGDMLFTGEQEVYGDVRQVVIGSLLGDGTIPSGATARRGQSLQITHGQEQEAYLRWKAKVLGAVFGGGVRKLVNGAGSFKPGGAAFRYASRDCRNLREFQAMRYPAVSDGLLAGVGPLALAVWFQDDGRYKTAKGGSDVFLHTNGFSVDEADRMRAMLSDKFGLVCSVDMVKGPTGGERRYPVLRLSRKSHDAFFGLVASFVHPSMGRKLPPEYRGRFAELPLQQARAGTVRFVAVEQADADDKAARGFRTRYNVTVEDNHNYLIATGFGGSFLANNCTAKDVTVPAMCAELGMSIKRVRRVVGICRLVFMRVSGPSGPTGGKEVSYDEIEKRCDLRMPQHGRLQGDSSRWAASKDGGQAEEERLFDLDMGELIHSHNLNGYDAMVVTFADFHRRGNYRVIDYNHLHQDTRNAISEIEVALGVPVILVRTGPGEHDNIFRPGW